VVKCEAEALKLERRLVNILSSALDYTICFDGLGAHRFTFIFYILPQISFYIYHFMFQRLHNSTNMFKASNLFHESKVSKAVPPYAMEIPGGEEV
jgi:hypothetical protein